MSRFKILYDYIDEDYNRQCLSEDFETEEEARERLEELVNSDYERIEFVDYNDYM
jgi:hypothetical protein